MVRKTTIGIMSDTHDNIYLVDRAVKFFNEIGVELVLHAGDYISPFIVSHFKPLKAKLIGVYGNNCAEKTQLRKLFSELGSEIRGVFAEIIVDGVRIALTHGHENGLLHSIKASKAYDVVIYGHTHDSKIQRIEATLVINPGEVCGYLSQKSTVAILDLETYEAEIIHI